MSLPPTDSPVAVTGDLFDFSGRRRAHDGLGHGDAVDHLIVGDRISRSALGRLGERFERGARHVQRSPPARPCASPFTGWNLQVPNSRVRRSSDEAPATCVTPSSRTQPFEPNTWKREPGPGRGHGAEITRHAAPSSGTGSRWCRRRRSWHARRKLCAKTWSIGPHRSIMPSTACTPIGISPPHGVSCLVGAPMARIDEQHVGKRHGRFDMQDGAELAAADHLAQLDHLGMEAGGCSRARA